MSIVDLSSLNLDNVPTLHHLPADTEVKLRITEVQTGVGGSGLTWWRLTCLPTDDDLAKEVREFVTVPDPTKQEPRKFAGTATRFKNFLAAFGLSTTAALNPESDLPGREAWALLGTKESEYGTENTVKRWMAPK